MEEVRKQFEEWIYSRRTVGVVMRLDKFEVDGESYYSSTDVQGQWMAWKASRSTPPIAYMTHHGSAVSPDDFADGEEEMHQAAKTEGWTPLISGITVNGD